MPPAAKAAAIESFLLVRCRRSDDNLRRN